MILLFRLFYTAVLVIVPTFHHHQTIAGALSIDVIDVDPDISQVVIEHNDPHDSLSCPSVDLILDDIEVLNVRNAELMRQIDNLNSVIDEQTALIKRLSNESVAITSAIVTTDCSEREIDLTSCQKHVSDLTTSAESMQAQLQLAARNQSMLEIKLSLEKNEKVIARLSRDNCVLELGNLKDVQDEDLAAAQREIVLLRNQLAHSQQSVSECMKTSTQCDRRAPAQLNGTQCDVYTCWDHFLVHNVWQWFPPRPVETEDTSNSRSIDTDGEEELRDSKNRLFVESPFDRELFESYAAVALTQLVLLRDQWLKLFSSIIYPNLIAYCSSMLSLQWSVVSSIIFVFQSLALEHQKMYNQLSPFLVVFYTTYVQPFISESVFPIYQQNVHPYVSLVCTSAGQWYSDHLAAHVAQYLIAPWEELMDILHRVLYFSIEFFFREDLYDRLLFFIEDAWDAVNWLSSTPLLVGVFGDSSIYITLTMMGVVFLWIAYCSRRVILGIIAIVLIIFLCPILLVLFVAAKILSWFLSLFNNAPMKKKVKKAKLVRDVHPKKSAFR